MCGVLMKGHCKSYNYDTKPTLVQEHTYIEQYAKSWHLLLNAITLKCLVSYHNVLNVGM